MAVEWNRVTWYSKLLATLLFGGAFFLGFYFGKSYKSILNEEQVLSNEFKTNSSSIGDEWRLEFGETINKSKPWELYINRDLGFLLEYPKEVAQGKVVFFQKDDIVFVTTETTELFKNKDSIVNPEKYDEGEGSWKIVIRNVGSEQELEKFIKDKYGAGCGLKGISPSKQEDLYEMEILTTSPQGDCWINWGIKTLYSPKHKKAALWDLGQDTNFYFETPTFVPIDGPMSDSFKFIDRDDF